MDIIEGRKILSRKYGVGCEALIDVFCAFASRVGLQVKTVDYAKVSLPKIDVFHKGKVPLSGGLYLERNLGENFLRISSDSNQNFRCRMYGIDNLGCIHIEHHSNQPTSAEIYVESGEITAVQLYKYSGYGKEDSVACLSVKEEGLEDFPFDSLLSQSVINDMVDEYGTLYERPFSNKRWDLPYTKKRNKSGLKIREA